MTHSKMDALGKLNALDLKVTSKYDGVTIASFVTELEIVPQMKKMWSRPMQTEIEPEEEITELSFHNLYQIGIESQSVILPPIMTHSKMDAIGKLEAMNLKSSNSTSFGQNSIATDISEFEIVPLKTQTWSRTMQTDEQTSDEDTYEEVIQKNDYETQTDKL